MDWYVRRGEKTKGPFPKAEILAAITAGKIGPDDTLCQKGTEEWIAVRDLGAFAAALPHPASPAVTEAPPEALIKQTPRPPAAEPSFVATLLDFSFKRFVVVQIVRWFYMATVAVAAMIFVALIVVGSTNIISAQIDLAAAGSDLATAVMREQAATKRFMAILTVVAAPFLAVLLVILGRIAAEMIVVIFSIAERLKPSG